MAIAINKTEALDMDNTEPATPGHPKTNQDDSMSSNEHENDVPSDQELVTASSNLGNTLDLIRAHDLLAQEKIRKAKQRTRKDRRIQDCIENQSRVGRGRYTFVISQATFNKIIQFLEESTRYKRVAVIDALKLAYEKGIPVSQNATGITSKTISRSLMQAFKALEIQIPRSKKPSLWTLIISHRLKNEAEATGIELEKRFTVV